jgi:hypothetical protein
MDIPYTGGILLDSTGSKHMPHKRKRPPRLAFLTVIHMSEAHDTQQKNSGPLNYAGPSNKS